MLHDDMLIPFLSAQILPFVMIYLKMVKEIIILMYTCFKGGNSSGMHLVVRQSIDLMGYGNRIAAPLI